LVLVATRKGPLLSPDSITYLSAAQHLREGAGLTDFTDRPLSVFGPIYPVLLSPGGRSLLWARVLGAIAAAAGTALLIVLLRRRVPPWAALAGGAAFGASAGLVSIASTAWSESPFLAIALATIVVLAAEPLTPRRAAVGGVLAGCGFLTRYAGVGLIVTGAAIVVVSSLGRGRRVAVRCLELYGGIAATTCVIWMARNFRSTGEPLGPRFSGGAQESVGSLLHKSTVAVGQLIVGAHARRTVTEAVGVAAVAALAVATIVVLRRRPPRPADAGVVVFGWSCLIVPVLARASTASDVDFRVLSPALLPVVYFGVVAIVSLRRWRPSALIGVGLAVWWMFQGVTVGQHFPDLVTSASAARMHASPDLYAVVADLPAGATVLTNNPQSVWWLTGRAPTLLAFTRPVPGRSHYPLDVDQTLAYACRGNAYLAWFDRLGNAGQGPGERRPDLDVTVGLTLDQHVMDGALYHLTPRDAALCRSP
jgi:hypothetical protein